MTNANTALTTAVVSLPIPAATPMARPSSPDPSEYLAPSEYGVRAWRTPYSDALRYSDGMRLRRGGG